MNIDQLRYFKQICECHSLNKAAQELYISQPALTKSIRAIEKELNIELLVRTKNGVYPSEIGGSVKLLGKKVMKVLYIKALQPWPLSP